MKYFIYITFLSYIFASCTQDNYTDLDAELQSVLIQASDNQSMESFIIPDSDNYTEIPQDPKNPITAEKVELGKLLFHETAFALDGVFPITGGTYSCASCHHADAGFQSGIRQGIGEGGHGFGLHGENRTRNGMCDKELVDVQPVRSPSVLNTAYQELMLWNGQFGSTGLNTGTESKWKLGTPIETNFLGYEGLEIQAIAGLSVHRILINDSLVNEYGYKNYFDQAFSDLPESSRYNKETAGLAIAAYERSVLANQAPFQSYLKGNEMALSESQKEGAILFFGKAGCVSCHNGPALSSMRFEALGMNDFNPTEVFRYDTEDAARFGRYSFTNNETDKYKFKVPQLYNLKEANFYGHGASFENIRDIIWYKNKGVAENPAVPKSQLAPEFQPLGLNSTEVENLTDFVVNALDDPNLDRFVPSILPSGNCFPNADIQSIEDLGCQ